MFQHSHNGNIETGVDRLLSLVKSRKEISLSDAAKTLNVSRDVVEHWSDVMCEQGLLKIRLSLRERYLVHPDYYKLSNGELSKLKEILSFKFSDLAKTTDLQGTILNEKAKEVRAEIKILESKIKELKIYENLKLDCEKRESVLKKQQLKLKSEKNKIESQFKLIERKEKNLEKKTKKVHEKKNQLSVMEKEMNNKFKFAIKLTAKLIKSDKKIAEKIKRLDKRERKLRIQLFTQGSKTEVTS